MNILYPIFALTLLWAAPASALSFDDLIAEDLEFITETKFTSESGQMMSLCYDVRAFTIFGFALTSQVKGYMLASERCEGTERRPIDANQMVTAQSLELVDPNLPPVAENDMRRNLQTYGLWVGLSLALFAVIWRRIKSLMGYDMRGPMRKKASHNILMAMCGMAKSDGLVSSQEADLIKVQMQRLARRDYAKTDIIRLADRMNSDMTPQDFIALGKGLRDREKDVMMQAVLSVAIADGRMMPAEHTFATELAHGLGMPAEDFRRVLNIALEDLNKMTASL